MVKVVLTNNGSYEELTLALTSYYKDYEVILLDQENLDQCLEQAEKWHDCIVLVRGDICSKLTSMSKVNKIISYLIVTSRKRNIDFIIITEDLEDLDLRIRRHWEVAERGTALNKYLEAVKVGC